MKEKIYEFRVVILIFFIGAILFGASKFVCKVVDTSNFNARSELADIQNKTASLNTASTNVLHQTKPYPFTGGVSLDGKTPGLDRVRWKEDAITFNEWVSDAFTYADSFEYTEHRKKYLGLLGETHPFMTNIMEPYEAKYGYLVSENYQVDDGTHISMMIKSMESYVDGIYDLNNDGVYETYSYITIITVDCNNYQLDHKGNPYQYQDIGKHFIVTYMIDDEGNIKDFQASPELQHV